MDVRLGQVWSAADFDGWDESGFDGGRGSCLAVTAQYVGDDGIWDTADDINDADLNAVPAMISYDSSATAGQRGGGGSSSSVFVGASRRGKFCLCRWLSPFL